MSEESFVNHRSFRWLWWNAALVFGLGVYYIVDRPVGGHRGSSLFGYVTGFVALIGIFILMAYGRRKRNYFSRHSTLKGSLSFHVWLGIALALIVPLHAGFHFGINVHSLTYALMMVVILSGMWGSVNYIRLSPSIESHRGGSSVKGLIAQIRILAKEIDELARSQSDQFLKFRSQIDFRFRPSYWRLLLWGAPAPINRTRANTLLRDLADAEHDAALKLIGLVNRKRTLVKQIQDELRAFFWIRSWLYVHLPLSFALLAAVAVHVFVETYMM